MSRVFISYRRDDAAGYAQAIYSQLERDLRRDQIFMDVDTIEPGVDFVTRIEQAVSECDVVIALIGKHWMGERENGPPRILDLHDFVHLEIATALSRNIRVIPVLVDGASMPSMERLPPALQPIVRRNALELSNTRYRFDLERVSQAVQKAVVRPSAPRRPKSQWQPWVWYGSLSVFLIAAGIAAGLWFKDKGEKPISETNVDERPRVEDALPGKEQVVKKEHLLEEEQRKREAQIGEVLGRARELENALQLTTPAQDNAARHYREVLKLDPNNLEAKQGLNRIGEQYVAWADQALSRSQFDNAEENLKRAASVTPDHPALVGLRRQLEERKARESEAASKGTALVQPSAKSKPQTTAPSSPGEKPVILVSTYRPGELRFDPRQIGNWETQPVNVSSPGKVPARVIAVAIDGADRTDFRIQRTESKGEILCPLVPFTVPQKGCTIRVIFIPTDLGSRTAVLSLASDAVDSPHKIILSGTGVPKRPASHDRLDLVSVRPKLGTVLKSGTGIDLVFELSYTLASRDVADIFVFLSQEPEVSEKCLPKDKRLRQWSTRNSVAVKRGSGNAIVRVTWPGGFDRQGGFHSEGYLSAFLTLVGTTEPVGTLAREDDQPCFRFAP